MNRSARLCACILNYIEFRNRVYRIALDAFPNGSPGRFRSLKKHGEQDYGDDTMQKQAREWDEDTMTTVGIKFSNNSIFKWLY